MKLKSFEAHGFKSFADKVELTFQQGITAIVGPNGSGKSNISDAIRWTLGEQSAKYLRGSKMEDVIFAGSSCRKALGMAEVKLVFDNEDHLLPLDFAEIAVRRRVYRSGESEYSINNKQCRLKDIVQLFADTGLGKGSMSIIGQNRVDEILSGRPEDRRALFEEAAGIAKYRLRKKEALHKLDETAANLIRISDIRSELASRLGPLKEAAAVAEQYLRYSAEQKQVRITLSVHNIENIAALRTRLKEKLDAATEQCSAAMATYGKEQATKSESCEAVEKLQAQFREVEESIAKRENTISQLQGKEAVLDERIKQQKLNITKAKERGEKVKARLGENKTLLAQEGQKYDAIDKKRLAAQEAANIAAKQRKQAAGEVAHLEEALRTYQSNAFTGMQEIVNLRNNIRSLTEEQQRRSRRRQQLSVNIEEAEKAYTDLTLRRQELTSEQGMLLTKQEFLTQEIAKLTAESAKAQRSYAEATEQLSGVRRYAQQQENKLDILRTMAQTHEGFSYGVRSVLTAREAWRQQVCGALADLISVESKYVTAVETVLGGALQNLVTEDAQVAQAAINYLRREQKGRATFLPLDTLRVRMPDARDNELLKLPGVLGWGSYFVSCSDRVRPAVDFLLARTLVTDDLEHAIAAARASRMTVRVVTLLGDIVAVGGSVSGGQNKKSSASFLSRQEEIKRLEESVATAQQEIAKAQTLATAAQEAAQSIASRLKEKSEQVAAQDVRKAELKAYLERLDVECQQGAENLGLLTSERTELNKEYLLARKSLLAAQEALRQAEEQDAAARQQADAQQKQLIEAKAQLTSASRSEQEARVEAESAKERSKACEERLEQLDEEAERLTVEQEEIEAEIAKAEKAITLATDEIAQLKQAEQAELAKIKDCSAEEALYRQQLTLAQQQLAEAEQRSYEAKSALTLCQQKQRSVELELVKREAEYNAAVAQLSSEYKLSVAEAHAEGQVLTESDTALTRRQKSLAEAIEALGPVNMGAIAEYKAVDERHKFLTEQYKDLAEAKERLESVIAGINADMSRKFREALNAINEHFATCFSKLFGGGRARLVVQEGADILETGIEIVAQPPGKKLQNLFLLSGGERALTVIALLFALLSYQPAPFCILDEIDAPLDDANIGRFAAFLKDFALRTQFIVITHRKGTMEAADILHGVTMEESGVSKLLSVKLAEIKE